MLFNSYIFILFFLPFTVSVYFLINKFQDQEKGKWDLWWLFLMSLWFYGYSNPVYLILILSSIGINFVLTKRITFERKKGTIKRARNWMLLGIVFNLALIFYFKYYDFFISNMNALFRKDWALKHIALPLGISFFTFQQISYVVDCYREKELIEYTFIEYAAYVTFFPQLVAGPIVMHSELVPQMQDRNKKKIDFENMSQGLYALALGLGKKVLLADTLSKIVAIGFADVSSLNRVSAIVIMLSYTLQIYFDFSGYCDMALGMSKMFNIDLPINFNSPYKAKTVNEFWERWHITLSRFFIHYVYIPLGGSRKGKLCTYRNTLIIFLLSGFWHGANWTYIVWGILHGTVSVFEKMVKDVRDAIKKMTRSSEKMDLMNNEGKRITEEKLREGVSKKEITIGKKVWKIGKDLISRVYLLVFINLTMMVFKADSIQQMKNFFHCLTVSGGGISADILEKVGDLVEMRLLYRLGLGTFMEAYPSLPCILLLMILWMAVLLMRNTQEKMVHNKYNTVRSLATIGLIVWSVISLSDVSEFLYFNF